MSSHISNPENALSKVADLIRVGKEEIALTTLHNILTSKRYRTYSNTHEKIIFKYIDLAVSLRKNARDAFTQYKYICQTNAESGKSSLERALTEYRDRAEAKALEAVAQADAKSLENMEDFDTEEQTPESIVLKAVSGEDAKARADRLILIPWLKYLWEAYRTILEVIRNNSTHQELYHRTSRQAFDFCKRFKRTTEFRRLCEILRNHVTGYHKDQKDALDLNSTDTQKLYLKTRFVQLNVAAELELWQDAYRTIEDIHEHMRLSKDPPRPQLLRQYYFKLTQIFWASENYLFHAYSLAQFYILANPLLRSTTSEGLTIEELQKVASAVVLATLAIPVGADDDGDNLFSIENEGNLRLASLLRFKKETPTRSRLKAELQSIGVLQNLPPYIRDCYNLLEVSYGPISLMKKLDPIIETLREVDREAEKAKAALTVDVDAKEQLMLGLGDANDKDRTNVALALNLSQYIVPIQKVVVLRLLQQLRSVYKVMRLEKFYALAPKLGVHTIERLIGAGVQQGQVQLRIDHVNGLMLFEEDSIESSRVKNQLVVLATKLRSCVSMIRKNDDKRKAAELEERQFVFNTVKEHLEDERKAVFVRKDDIELRKIDYEEMESRRLEREEKDRRDAAEREIEEERQRKETEKETRIRAQEEKDRRAKIDERKQILANKLLDQAEEIIEKKGSSSKAIKTLKEMTQDLDNVEEADLIEKMKEVELQSQREREQRLKEAWRRINYTCKALRLTEAPLIATHQELKKKEKKTIHEENFKLFLKNHKLAHERALEDKQRLNRMVKQKESYQALLMSQRTKIFEKQKAIQMEQVSQHLAKLAEEAAKKKAEEEEIAKKKREQAALDEREQKEKQRREEAEKAAMEEKRAMIQAKRKERMEDPVMLKQREREAEAEAREREERAKRLGRGMDSRDRDRGEASTTDGASSSGIDFSKRPRFINAKKEGASKPEQRGMDDAARLQLQREEEAERKAKMDMDRRLKKDPKDEGARGPTVISKEGGSAGWGGASGSSANVSSSGRPKMQLLKKGESAAASSASPAAAVKTEDKEVDGFTIVNKK